MKSGDSGAQVKLLTAKLSIGIFTLLKLCLADAIRNFKWVKMVQIWQNEGQRFRNLNCLKADM